MVVVVRCFCTNSAEFYPSRNARKSKVPCQYIQTETRVTFVVQDDLFITIIFSWNTSRGFRGLDHTREQTSSRVFIVIAVVVVVVYVAFVDVCRGDDRGGSGGRSVENPADQYTPAPAGLTRPSFRFTTHTRVRTRTTSPSRRTFVFPFKSPSEKRKKWFFSRIYSLCMYARTRFSLSSSSSSHLFCRSFAAKRWRYSSLLPPPFLLCGRRHVRRHYVCPFTAVVTVWWNGK